MQRDLVKCIILGLNSDLNMKGQMFDKYFM